MNLTLQRLYIDILDRKEWVVKIEPGINGPNTYTIYVTYLHNPSVFHCYVLTPTV